MEPGVTRPADLLVAVVLLGQDTQGRLDDSSPQPEDQMEGGLLLDVVVRESPPVLQLLSSEDQPLLVGGDPLLVLDFSFHVLDRVAGLDLQGDGLSSQRLDEDLHDSLQHLRI